MYVEKLYEMCKIIVKLTLKAFSVEKNFSLLRSIPKNMQGIDTV